ncbi:fungal-specific transcription factor domain-containing protein [Umbelopsis sp. PMI_123]|nr:fungal-specific transcription factor domain-containing protein [Umbelopsis sp. PMI_123]
MASHSPLLNQHSHSSSPRSTAKSKASHEAHIKRLKVGRACFTCRQKKIKCDGVQPCMQCKARRRPCTFSKDGATQDVDEDQDSNAGSDTPYLGIHDDRQSESFTSHSDPYKSPRPSREKPKVQRVEKTEDFLFSWDGDSASGVPQKAVATSLTRTQEILDSLCNNTMEISGGKRELHSFKLTTETSLYGSQGSSHIWEPEPPLPSTYNGPLTMPPKATQELLIKTYFEKRHNVFPVMPRRMLMQQLSVKGYLITPLLLNAMYAHAAVNLNEKDADLCEPAHVYFDRAKLLIDDFLDTPRISTVIALCLLSLFEFQDPLQARFCRTSVYSGVAFRLCYDLGMCQSYTIGDRMTNNDIELRKRVFWGCYCLDKMQSIDTDGAWMIRSEDFEIDMPVFQTADFATEHETLEGFVAYIKLMQIAERVMHFESFQVKQTMVRTREHEQMLLSFNNDLINWLRSLPPHLQWTPLPTQANATAPHPPANAIVSHIHLAYNVIELSVLKPYANSTNKLIQHRCYTVAENVTQLATFLYQHRDFIATYRFLASALMRASVVHMTGLDDHSFKSNNHPQKLLQTSLKILRDLLQHRSIPSVEKFAFALQNSLANERSSRSTSSSPRDIETSPQPRRGGNTTGVGYHHQGNGVSTDEDSRSDRTLGYSEPHRAGQKRSYSDRHSPAGQRQSIQTNHMLLNGDEQRAAEVLTYAFPSQHHIPTNSSQRQSSLRYTSGQNPTEDENYAINFVMGDHWPPTSSSTATMSQNAVVPHPATFSQGISPQGNPGEQSQPHSNPTFNSYSITQKHQRDHSNHLVALVPDPMQQHHDPHPNQATMDSHHATTASPGNVSNRGWDNPSHAPSGFDNRNDPLLYSIAAAAAASSNDTWPEPENDKWLSSQNMFDRSPTQQQRADEQARFNITPQQPQYMNIGLGVYASAHQHHTDVIRQHFMGSDDRNNNVRPVILTHHGNVVVANENNVNGLARDRPAS